MKLKIYKVISSKFEWENSAEDFFITKIKRYVPIEVIAIKSPSMDRKDSAIKIKAEEALILKKLNPNDYIILLDEKGKSFSDSVEFSKNFIKKLEQYKNISFIIGGAFGVSEGIKERAQEKLSLSKLTMNHPLAFVVMLEQIYRSICISKGLPYHNK